MRLTSDVALSRLRPRPSGALFLEFRPAILLAHPTFPAPKVPYDIIRGKLAAGVGNGGGRTSPRGAARAVTSWSWVLLHRLGSLERGT